MKKYNIKINLLMVITILAVAFTACNNDDEYEKPNTFSDVGWYVGYPVSPLPDTLLANKDNYITFSDLSQNALSHEWKVGSGNFYLSHPIQREDSIFDDKIIGAGNSPDKTVSVLFKNSGYNHVTLFNTFSEKVTFRGPDDENIEAEQVGDNWVIEKTFVVDVYDTIVPKIRIEQKGEVRNHESTTDTIFVEAGDSLEFFDETETGRPDNWSWNIAGSSSNEQNPSIVLKKLGVFAENTVTFRRAGNNIPTDWETYEIPVPIRVIPSSQPFVQFGDVYELEDETIIVPFNGEFAPFINQEQFFSVMLDGTTPLQIASVGINDADATLLEIKLSEPIYAADNITVSYDGNGTLQSTDTRSPVAFSDEPVTMFSVNLAPAEWNMEDAAQTAWISTDAPVVEYSTEQVHEGNYSIKINSSGPWARASIENHPVNITEAGSYTITWWMYIDSSTTTGSYGPWFYWADDTAGQQFWQGIRQACCGGPKPLDQWFKQTREQNLTPGAAHFTLRVNNDALMYFDDVQIVKTEKRP